MKRNCSLEEISDGKLYEFNDMVKAGCNGCGGNASCCHGMGASIILDPYDLFCLTTNLKLTFEELLEDKLELNVVDGVVLPNLKMTGASECCSFLNSEGRCTIHSFRPGICRIFPLGRYYENHDFKYFLQRSECKNPMRTKLKVSKWIDTPDYKSRKKYLIDWHYFLNDVEVILQQTEDANLVRNINMYLLNTFYGKSYDNAKDFYSQFEERLHKTRTVLEISND